MAPLPVTDLVKARGRAAPASPLYAMMSMQCSLNHVTWQRAAPQMLGGQNE